MNAGACPSQRRLGRCVVALVGGMASFFVATSSAFAYRPFDGTDGAVAEEREMELEMGPIGYLRDERRSLVAPAFVYNLGILPGWELVAEGRGNITLETHPEVSLREAGLTLKHVLRDGVLQDRDGPSIATEFGMLAPTGGVEKETGTGTFALIVSERWGWLTAHLNLEAALTRDRGAGVFGGIILEGPMKWPARPVTELFVARDPGAESNTYSGLLGMIWPAGESVDFDMGARIASEGSIVGEIRAGLTWRIDTK